MGRSAILPAKQEWIARLHLSVNQCFSQQPITYTLIKTVCRRNMVGSLPRGMPKVVDYRQTDAQATNKMVTQDRHEVLSRENSLFDIREITRSFLGPQKIFVLYLAPSSTFIPYMTLRWIFRPWTVNCHAKRRFYPCGPHHPSPSSAWLPRCRWPRPPPTPTSRCSSPR